jgi:tetratricopeptide (TPR) repeat protein
MDHEVVTRLTDLLHGAARSAGVRKAAVTLVRRHPGILLPVLVQAAADPRGREQADAVRIVGDWMKSRPSVSNLGLLFGLLPDGSPQVVPLLLAVARSLTRSTQLRSRNGRMLREAIRSSLADTLRKVGHAREAEPLARRAAAELKRMRKSYPRAALRESHARAVLSAVLATRGDHLAALAMGRQAVRELPRRGRSPDALWLQHGVLNALANRLFEARRPSEALPMLEEASGLLKRLDRLGQLPKEMLPASLLRAAHAYFELGMHVEAIPAAKEAWEAWKLLAADNPPRQLLSLLLAAEIHSNLLLISGSPEPAHEVRAYALGILATLAKQDPLIHLKHYVRELAGFVGFCLRSNRPEVAEEAGETAVALLPELRRVEPGRDQFVEAGAWLMLGESQLVLRKFSAALESGSKAIKNFKRAEPSHLGFAEVLEQAEHLVVRARYGLRSIQTHISASP